MDHVRRPRHRALAGVIGTLAIAATILIPASAAAGGPPVISWTPSTSGSFGYGTVDLGQTLSQAFTLTNSGGSATGALSVTLTGAGFTKTSDACTAVSVGPKKVCVVTVLYSPTAAGSSDAGSLAVSSKKPAAGATIALTGSGTAAVARHIYWTQGSSGQLGRANVDGTGVTPDFITGAGYGKGLTLDDEHLYWANTDIGLGRANIDGTSVSPSFIASGQFTGDVAVDPNFVYWTNGGGLGSVGRTNVDGTSANPTFIAGTGPGVAVDATYIYFTSFSSIARAKLDGSEANLTFIPRAAFIGGLAADATHIYWANANAGTIGRANLDGTDVNETFITSAGYVGDVTLDDDFVYWNDVFGGRIGRANIDGSNPNGDFMTGLSFPSGIAVD